jgi:hypothetical protein
MSTLQYASVASTGFTIQEEFAKNVSQLAGPVIQ